MDDKQFPKAIDMKQIQVEKIASCRVEELEGLHASSTEKAPIHVEARHRRRRTNAYRSYQMSVRNRMPETGVKPKEEETFIDLAATNLTAKKTKARKMKPEPRSRDHCRRPQAILQDRRYCDDSTKSSKLPTHFWHRKRMIMKEQWGYILAENRTDRGISAAIKSYKKHCTIYDASHYGISELHGSVNAILGALKAILGPSFEKLSDMSLLSGTELGEAIIYNENKYPVGRIAPIEFMWRPMRSDYNEEGQFVEPCANDRSLNDSRQLWIWTHASAFKEVHRTLSTVFQSWNEKHQANDLTLVDRRGKLSRFEIRGKKAASVIESLFRPTDVDSNCDPFGPMVESDYEAADIEVATSYNKTSWSNLARGRKGNAKCSVMCLLVKDVRLFRYDSGSIITEPSPSDFEVTGGLESKIESEDNCIVCPVTKNNFTDSTFVEHSKAMLDRIVQWSNETPANKSHSSASIKENQKAEEDNADPRFINVSPLWSLDIVEQWYSSYEPDHIVNGRGPLENGRNCNSMFAMLIKRKGSPQSWDVVVSPERAANVFKALVFAGAHAIGRVEHSALQTLQNVPAFPEGFPDTSAGARYWDSRMTEAEKQHLARPKGKRVNYKHLKVDHPFRPSWESILPQQGCPFFIQQSETEPCSNSLKMVSIKVLRRGMIEPCSMICLPKPSDAENFSASPKWFGEALNKKDESDRRIIGFITSSLYDRSSGVIRAIGFIAGEAVESINPLEKDGENECYVMIRNPTSNFFRPASLKYL